MKRRELHRKQTEKLNDLEIEAKEKAEYLLQNANAQRMEQEDEIKHLNEVSCFPVAAVELPPSSLALFLCFLNLSATSCIVDIRIRRVLVPSWSILCAAQAQLLREDSCVKMTQAPKRP